ncbi:hypothetical protein [Thermosediminibacter litoriperuensis]|uniref:Homeodomain-like domain-containing protein n=1 Tax=Thermosediminibacter litoriperuensis TaxID=291989 RepID=A0A5S5AJU6_9FIRM|nr:hypothetical protein [Thermosediminibacter litoriperuensis]TYP50370.1 hypothetical protein LZ11_02024 [Thermosediminibacter litoriperuensis]
MKKKSKTPRILLRPEESLTDYLELFEEGVRDEDIARDMNVDVETVRSIRGELDTENTSPKSIFFKKTRGKN